MNFVAHLEFVRRLLVVVGAVPLCQTQQRANSLSPMCPPDKGNPDARVLRRSKSTMQLFVIPREAVVSRIGFEPMTH